LALSSVNRLFLLAACSVLSARAVELHIQFNALERMLAETVFTQDGRRYVQGDKNNKCNFAYLEKPHVRGEAGRLVIRARFTGRSALNALGVCVGLGDAFNAVISTTPEFHDGNIVLAKVNAASEGKTGIYIRRVCTALSSSLGHSFKYPISDQFQKALEDPAIQPTYPRQLRNFNVPAIRVSDDALVLVLDFDLTVK
jgi:hypothetical protein